MRMYFVLLEVNLQDKFPEVRLPGQSVNTHQIVMHRLAPWPYPSLPSVTRLPTAQLRVYFVVVF